MSGTDLLSTKDWSFNYYRFLAFLPVSIHTILMITRYDMSSALTWGAEIALLGLAFLSSRYIRREHSKIVKHILISPNYHEIIFGVENLKNKVEGETLPPHVNPIPSTTYTKVPLENLLFFGYYQVYSRVKSGSSLSDAEAQMAVNLEGYQKEPHILGEILKLGFNKKQLLLTAIYYDKEQNKYVEVEIDPNKNSLEELDDYLMCLVKKQKMKFFTGTNS